MTSPVYDALLSEITDELEHTVLVILIERAGQKTTRQDMVMAVFGHYVLPSQLAASTEDRKIREVIERLRAKDWPIVSSSGEAGYILEDNEERIREFAAEQQARAEKNRQTALSAYRWLPKARTIREMRRSNLTVTQPKLI